VNFSYLLLFLYNLFISWFIINLQNQNKLYCPIYRYNKSRPVANLKIPQQAADVKVEGKDNVDTDLRIKRDIDNLSKSKDIKNNDKSKTKTNVNKFMF
jgi:hypothetical protein